MTIEKDKEFENIKKDFNTLQFKNKIHFIKNHLKFIEILIDETLNKSNNEKKTKRKIYPIIFSKGNDSPDDFE